MLLVGVTVALIAAASLHLVSRERDPVPTPQLELVASMVEGGDSLALTHAGGSAFDPTNVRALVAVNDAPVYDGLLAADTSLWQVGDTRQLAMPSSVPAGARVSISLVDLSRGLTLATAELRIPAAAAAPSAGSGFSLQLIVEQGATEVVVEPPAEILVEATIAHDEGRKFVRHVYADLSGVEGPAWAELRDDGTRGDRVPGDGIYSAFSLVPLNVTSGEKTLRAHAVDFNGTRASAEAKILLIKREDVTEESLNPTGSPAPNGTGPCPDGKAVVQSYRHLVNGQRGIADMTGNIRQGDHVRAFVTIPPSCSNIEVTLVSYKAPTPYFSWSNAHQQSVYRFETKVLGPGEHSLSVNVPDCYFQVALAIGPPIAQPGPQDSDNFYSRQGRLLDADNGGTTPCP